MHFMVDMTEAVIPASKEGSCIEGDLKGWVA